MAKASLPCGQKRSLRTNGVNSGEVVVEDAVQRRGSDSNQSTSETPRDGYPQAEPHAVDSPEQSPGLPPETFTVHHDRTEPNRGQLPGDHYIRVGRRLPGRLLTDGDYHVLPGEVPSIPTGGVRRAVLRSSAS